MLRCATHASGLARPPTSTKAAAETSAARGSHQPGEPHAGDEDEDDEQAEPELEGVDEDPEQGEAVGLLVEVHPVQRRRDDDEGQPQSAPSATRSTSRSRAVDRGALRTASATVARVSTVAAVSWPKPWCT